ncbi:MAG: hypothetical protein JXR91_17220 [Deltaproteobacteria bacterium]|nr:hypothetical protein [Deltaproteobacteria bacterium]
MILLISLSISYLSFADTDSDTTINSSDYWDVSIINRDENSSGIKVLTDNIKKFSRQDCLDDVQMDFGISLLGDAKNYPSKTVYLYVGEECDSTSGIGDCTKIDSDITSTGNLTFKNISLSSIFESMDCDADNTVSKELWIALLDAEGVIDTGENDIIGTAITLKLDTSQPSVIPDNIDYSLGDGSVTIKWDKIDNSDVAGYAAFYVKSSDSSCSGAVLESGSSVDLDLIDGSDYSFSNSTATSLTVSGLDNDSYYMLAVASLDESGNNSVLSESVCTSPVPTIGIGSALNTDGGYCFIATAAFGSYDHPVVKVLRVFRDNFLKEMPFGNKIISAYYSAGPSMALIIEQRPLLKKFTVSALSLFAGFSTILVKIGPLYFIFGIMLSILLGMILGVAIPLKRSRK